MPDWKKILLGTLPALGAVGSLGALMAMQGGDRGGKRGVPNPPKDHWTQMVKKIQNKYKLTWKQAIKKWNDLGKPNPTLPASQKEEKKIKKIKKDKKKKKRKYSKLADSEIKDIQKMTLSELQKELKINGEYLDEKEKILFDGELDEDEEEEIEDEAEYYRQMIDLIEETIDNKKVDNKKVDNKKERKSLSELNTNYFKKRINEAGNDLTKLFDIYSVLEKWKPENLDKMPQIKKWAKDFYSKYGEKIKEKIYIDQRKKEKEKLQKIINKFTKNKNDEIKKIEKEYIKSLSKKKQNLLKFIENDIQPTNEILDDIKVMTAGISGKISSYFKDLPYDKYDKQELSFNIKALQNIINKIIKYINKYRNNTTTKKIKKVIKKTDKNEKEEKDENENLNPRQIADKLYWFEQPEYIDELEDKLYDKELLKYYNDLMKNLNKAITNLNNKKNKSEKEEYVLNELEADKIDLEKKMKKITGGGPCCSTDADRRRARASRHAQNVSNQINRNINQNIQQTRRINQNLQIAQQTTQRLLEQQREEARRNDISNAVRSRINFPNPQDFRRNRRS